MSNLLFINSGPVWYPRSKGYRSKFLLLSDFCSGSIITTSSDELVLNIKNFTFYSIKDNKKFKKIRLLMFCMKKIMKIHSANKIDCIIVYDPLFTGILGVIFKLLCRCKLVVEVNGVYNSSHNWNESFSIKNLFKKKLAIMVMMFVLKFSDGIKLLFCDQLLSFNKIIKRKKISVFADFVSIENFNNIREDKIILFVGHPFYLKGVDILIKSFRKIHKEYPDWSLKILGWFPDKSDILNLINNDQAIMLHPPVPSYEIPKHVGTCGIFVLPSRSEAMGRVLVEAAAAGKPRIASNTGGIPTVINNGIDGFLFETENTEQLADILSKLMADSDLRLQIGNRARERAVVDFNESSYVNKYVNFINEVLEKK